MQKNLAEQPIRVLHLEDNDHDRHAVAKILRHAGLECRFSVVQSETEFVDALRCSDQDIIISDFTLPVYDGWQALLTSRKLRPEIPFVFFSGTISEEMAVDSLKNGASDYVSKRSPERLAPAIRDALRNARARARLRPLRQSTERLNLISRATNDVTWDWDLKTNKIQFSPNFQTVFGHAIPESGILPGQWFDFIHPDEKVSVTSGISSLLSNRGQIWRSEHRLRRADRSFAHVLDRASVIYDDDGQPARVVGMMIDMTDGKQAEKKLIEECSLLRTLIDLIPDIIFVKDRCSQNVFANRAAVEFFGAKSPAEMEGKRETSFFQRPVAETFKRDNEQVIATGLPLANREDKITTLGGKIQWLSTNRVPWRDKDGNIIGLVGISRNITEQKLAQEQVSQQAMLLDAAHDVIFVQDLQGRVLYWNQRARQVLGHSPEAVLGQSPEKIWHKDPAAFREALRATLVLGEWSGDLTFLAKNHGEIIVQSRWTLVLNPAGEPQFILNINHDITEKKQLEAQFLRVQRMDNIGKLASGITHDLNNILAPILISTSLLRKKIQDGENLNILTMLENNAKRAANIVKQVLWFGRGSEGQRALLNPWHLLKEIAQTISETFDRSIQIETEAAPDVWPVVGDPTQLHQALLNLCVNARDAMPKGGKLTCSARNYQPAAGATDAKARPYVILSVTDTGTGIAPEIEGRIFEPFFTTKEPGKGTGLGLYTTLSIVKEHHGFIQVNSQPGRGSTFEIYLPAQTTGGKIPDAPSERLLPGNNETILVVDDEASIRESLKRTLETFDYRVLVACNGREALDVHAQNASAIAAVIVDLMMPVMNGSDFIRALKETHPQTRIIITTGIDTETLEAEAAALGIRHFIPKPFSTAAILEKMQAVLGASQPQ